jgi:hypothetical protein
MPHDDELGTRPGVFLQVQRLADGYEETSVNGETQHFTRKVVSQSVTVERLTVHKEVDLNTGKLRPLITGITHEYIRALGTEGEYPVFDVRVVSDVNQARAMFVGTYGSGGHALGMAFNLYLPEPAVVDLVDAIEKAKSVRSLRITFKPNGFVCSYQGREGVVLLLPVWSEQNPVKEAITVGNRVHENIRVEWQFTIEGVSMHPQHWYPMLGQHDDDELLSVSVQNRVGMQYVGEHPMKEPLQALQKQFAHEVTSIKYVLYVIAVALAALVYLFWR